MGNDFINLDKNIYTDNDDVNVLIYDQSTSQSNSENEDNERDIKVNYEENQLKTYKEVLIYMNKFDSELLETISWTIIQVEKNCKKKTTQKT